MKKERLQYLIDKTISIYKKKNGKKTIRPMKRPNHHLCISFRRWGWVVAAVLLLLAEVAVVMLAINANREQQDATPIIQNIR